MEYKEYSAKTVSDCITDACTTLGVPSDRLDYEVVSEGSSGFMGIGSKPAVIKARIKEEVSVEKNNDIKLEDKNIVDDAKTVKEETKVENKNINKVDNNLKAETKIENKNINTLPVEKEVKEKAVKNIAPEVIDEMKKAADKFLNEVFGAMGIKAVIKCEYDASDNILCIDVSGDDMGILIGKRGQTLDSLQYLVSLVINKGTAEYVRVKVDTENYRARRKETLENLAKNISFKVKRTRRPVTLEPMNPYERRIIHSALQNDRYVTTHSEGEEPFRKVVVTLKK